MRRWQVVLDTNILVADPRLSGTQFGIFLKGLKLTESRAYVPAVVLEELVNQVKERLQKQVVAAEGAISQVERLTGVRIQFDSPDLAAEVAKYREYVQSRFEENGIEILPIPMVPHEEVLGRELQRRKPFGGRSGYRDFLIWKSVLELLRRVRHGIVFLTQNTRDFGDDDELHPDLRSDVLELFSGVRTVRLVTGLSNFNEEFVKPVLGRDEAMRAALTGKGVGEVDIVSWLKRNLDTVLTEEALLQYGADLPSGVGSAGRPQLAGIPVVRIGQVFELDTDLYLAEVDIELLVTYPLEFDYQDYQESEMVRELLGDDGEPFEFAILEWDAEFRVDGLLRIAGAPPRPLDLDVREIEARHM